MAGCAVTVGAGSARRVTGITGAIKGAIVAQAAAGAVIAVHGSGGASVTAAVARPDEHATGTRMVSAPADFPVPAAPAVMVGRVAQAGRIDASVRGGTAGAAGVAGPFAPADADAPAGHALPGRIRRPRDAASPYPAVRDAFGGIMAFVRHLALETVRAGKAARRAGPAAPAEIAPPVLFPRGAGAMRIAGQAIGVDGGPHA